MNLKRLHYFVCIAMLLLTATQALAQNKRASGTVTDAKTGLPLQGVSILAKGTTVGTQTNANGTFTLELPSGANQLEISYVGYTTQTISAKSQASIALQPEAGLLNDVVVIGYGTAKKKDLTGSIATISSKDFNPGLATTPEQLIAGKAAGVTITPNGGQPGQGSTIRIRQGASLNASNDPLIVIDGVPVTGGLSGTGGSQNSGVSNALSLINPADIETFNILKDAASTAIYGSRASNGVILITTRKGRSGKPVVDFSTQFSISKASKYAPVLSGNQFRTLVDSVGTPAEIAELGNANTDWQKEIFQTAIGTNNNIAVAGSIAKKLPYRLSFNYTDQNGILKTDNLQRYTGGLRLNPRLLQDHLKIDFNINGAIVKTRFANQDAILAATLMNPTEPVYQANSPWGGYFEYASNGSSVPISTATRNPLALLEQKFDKSNVQKLYGNLQLDYKFHFLPDLHANLNLGYEGAKGDGGVNVANNAAQSWGAGTIIGDGYKSKFLQKYRNTTFEFYLNYLKDIPSIKSNINATAGYGYYDYLTTNYNYANLKANGDTILNSIPTFPFDKPRFTLLSYYGRLIYTFDTKYILAASLRTDGSSRFSPANRWGVFPSVAFTWKVGQEQFLINSKTVSNLNLRLSYGVTGNQDGISLYSYIPNYSLSTNASLYQIGNTFYHVYAPIGYNSNLKWEQTATYNAGLDFGFLHNRISGSFDLYNKKTTNLLQTVNVTPGTNFANQITANVGSMTTKGVELALNFIPVQTNHINWNVGFNIAYNDRKITKLTLVNDPSFVGFTGGGISGGTGTTVQITAVNNQPNAFYLYKQVYDKTTGKPLEGVYEDQNGDGIINESDLHIYKSPYPKYIMGFTTSLSVDKWSLSTTLHSNLGNYVYNNALSNVNYTNALFNTVSNTLQNTTTAIYKNMFKNAQYLSDYYVENASFLKMDNVSISYNVGKIAKNKITMQVSGTVQNVFTITKYTGLNPEVYNGIDNKLYPIPRIYVLGLNFRF